MAIIKLYKIKSSLKSSINYITNEEKTDNKTLISTFMCGIKSAHIQFLNTRDEFSTRGTILARHLIQSFVPNEITPENAHEIGKTLCDRILNNNHEYIISTHIDKNHVHNHIIFNNVSFKTGKCYRCTKRVYYQIAEINNDICRENNLSVIEEPCEVKFQTRSKGYYEYKILDKKDSWKFKLQCDLDKAVINSNSWEHFLELMKQYGYEILFKKYILFKHKTVDRFTRSQTIGKDYTEDRLKERIKSPKTIKEIININKISSKYRHWARKQNLHTISENIIELKNQNINSISELKNTLVNKTKNLFDIKDKILFLDNEISHLKEVIENINIVKNSKSKNSVYENALNFLKKHYTKMPDSKEILENLQILREKRNTLIEEYSQIQDNIYRLSKVKDNYIHYLNREL